MPTHFTTLSLMETYENDKSTAANLGYDRC